MVSIAVQIIIIWIECMQCTITGLTMIALCLIIFGRDYYFFFFSLNSSWMFNVCYTILSLTFLGRPYLCFCSSKRVISPCTYFLWSLFTCWGLGFATALFTGIGAPTTDKEKFKWKRKIYKLREKWKCGGFQSCTLHTTRGQLGNKLGRVIAYW